MTESLAPKTPLAPKPSHGGRPVVPFVDAAVFIVALLVLAGAVNYFAQQASMRVQMDATKTRAYSLSDQTRGMLTQLEGDWLVAVILVEAEADHAMTRQVDEVLRRFDQASDRLDVMRIDPSDPRNLPDYEALLARLRDTYAARTRAYDMAIADGVAAFESLQLFAQREGRPLQLFVESLPAGDPDREALLRRARLLALVAAQGKQVLDEVESAMRTDDARPLPDYDTARSILAAALREWAQEVNDVGRILRRRTADASATPEMLAFAGRAAGAYETLAPELAVAADPLRRLPPLELSEIGRQLQGGEAAIVLGPDRAGVISSAQLFPRGNIRTGEAAVSFDQRFRGEQLIASTIRSLLVEQMPLVVFTHSVPGGLLGNAARDIDLAGVRSMLAAARFDVAQWNAADEQRPAPEVGRPVVWVVIPPPQRSGIAPDAGEQKLIAAVGKLIDEGQPVLLNLHPSMLPAMGRRDAWADLARRLGVEVDSGQVVFQAVPGPDGTIAIERGATTTGYPADHAIGRTLEGQRSYFPLPLPMTAAAATQLRVQPLVNVAAGADRWLERDWNMSIERLEATPEERRLEAPVTIAMASERSGSPGARAIVVGSGGWMLSYIADVAVGVGGERFALLNPANHELLMNAVAWLAGMDDLIGAGPAGQQIARLQQVTPAARRFWLVLCVAVLPAAWLVMGMGVWFVRRR